MEQFYELGIEKTKDKHTIKNAYRSKLTSVNPEDDPEGFKRLREAYEEALRYCDLPDDEEMPPDNSPVGQWIRKLEETYRSIQKRQDPECWKLLFEDNICLDLDTSTEARERLIAFLMDHYRFPQHIYQLIDETFHIVEDKSELVSQFPENFMDYFEFQTNTEEFIDYSLFDGDDSADYDGYISAYLSIKEKVDMKNFDRIEEDFAQMEQFRVLHPYIYVERFRIAMEKGDCLAEGKLFKERVNKYRENIYIRYYIMLVEWENKNYEQAFKDIQYLLEKYPAHYSAKKKLAEYHFMNGRYDQAKEICLDLLELNLSDEDALSLMRETNIFLIEKFGKDIEDDPDNRDSYMELGWCYYQNELFEECLTHLNKYEPSGKYILDYNNLKSRNYIEMNRYEDALPCLVLWEEELAKLIDDGSEEFRKKKRRYGLARYLRAVCYAELSKEAENPNQNKEIAINFLQGDLDSWEDVGIRLNAYRLKAQMLLELGRNEQCIDICEHILQTDAGYYPAYLYMQEAYFNLKEGQPVIDSFYQMIDIYPLYVKPYILTAKVFYYFGQYDDAKNIIRMAREKDLASNELDLVEIKTIRYSAATKEETLKSIALCDMLEPKLFDEENDIDDISQVYLEKIFAYMDLRDFHQALTLVNDLISSHPQNDVFHVKANILTKLDRYQEARTLYQQCLKSDADNISILYDMAQCHERMDMTDLALEQYERILKSDASHPYANARIMNIYKRRYEKRWCRQSFEQAIKHATSQLEILRNSYYLIERGLVYTDGRMFEEAISDFEAAIEDDPQDVYGYNNLAYVYELDRRYQAALEMYQLAIETDTKRTTSLPYNNLGNLYLVMHEYDKAYDIFMKSKEIFHENPYRNLTRVCRLCGRYDEAIVLYENQIGSDQRRNIETQLLIAETYAEKSDYQRAEKYFFTALKQDSSIADTHYRIGEYYYYVQGKRKKALSYFKKAYQLAPENDLYCIQLVEMYAVLGKQSKAEKYFEKALMCYQNSKQYGNIESFLDNPDYKIINHYRIFRLYLFAGHKEQAKAYMEQMFVSNRCSKCYFNQCCEAYIAKGLYLEAIGDTKGAIAAYQTALSEDRNESVAQAGLKRLEEEL